MVETEEEYLAIFKICNQQVQFRQIFFAKHIKFKLICRYQMHAEPEVDDNSKGSTKNIRLHQL